MANMKATKKNSKTTTQKTTRTRKPRTKIMKALDNAGEQLERAQAAAVESKQPRFAVTRQQAVNLFNQIYGVAKEAIFNEPPYAADSTRLDTWLAKVVKKEPYLLGILQSVVSIDKNRGWTLVGGKIQVKKFVNILHNFQAAPDLFGWRNGLSVSAQNFYQSNLGAVVEIGRSQINGPLAGLYTVDPTKCKLTGKENTPLKYTNGPRDRQDWEPTDYFRVASFPSPAESLNGLGMCAVYRCIELAKLLVSVFEHDKERLGSKAPKGILTINGVTESQWLQSLEESPMDLKTLEREYYSGVQVLANDGNPEIKVGLTSLSNLPEQFDHRQFVDMIIYGYALAFGYDPREFWPVSSGSLGTATEAESQHRRASSKGGLDFALGFQERLQDELPETVEFEFEQRDVQGDIAEADYQKKELDIIQGMFTGVNSANENLITLVEARQLLVDAGLIPDEWTPEDENAQATDTDDFGELIEKQRVQYAIEKFPNEDIVMYSSRTNLTRVIRKAGTRHFMTRVIQPEISTEKIVTAIDKHFTEMKREAPSPVTPTDNASAILANLLQDMINPGKRERDAEHQKRLQSIAESLNLLAERSQPAEPAPIPTIEFNPVINVPDILIPRMQEPINQIIVQPAAAPINHISVQPAAAPVNQITVQPADVKIPRPIRETQAITRDENNLIESTETEIEYE